MLDHLPNDVLVDIFLRLPLKLLVLCACTCKTLNSCIKNPKFITAYNKKSKENPFVFLRYYVKSDRSDIQRFSVHKDVESSIWEFRMMTMPMKSNSPCFEILGSFNGVICLYDDELAPKAVANVIYLWNPSISRYLELPLPNVTLNSNGPFDMCLGFGFHELANDYKVVRIVYLEECHPLSRPRPLVEIYTKSSGSWRFIRDSSPHYRIRTEHSNCFVKGNIHWLGYDDRGSRWHLSSSSMAIVTFDVSAEKFGEIKFPSCLEEFDLRVEKLTLRSCWGMLALINVHEESYSRKDCCIWVMKEYGDVDSWCKMFKFEHPRMDLKTRTITFRKNKDILMFMHNIRDKVDMLFSGSNGEFEVSRILRGPLNGLYMDSYEESLALFDDGKSIMADVCGDDDDEHENVDDIDIEDYDIIYEYAEDG
ncbi:unnamed protein product [Amaranthus hypochondriacus]